MRRRLRLIVLAVTSMVAVAFLLPLAVLVRSVAADRAKSATEQEARSLAGVLAAGSGRREMATIVDQLNATSPRRAGVLLQDGTVIGAASPVSARGLAAARQGRAFTATTSDAHVVVVPVRTSDGAISVAVVSVPKSELSRGVLRAWALLALLGVALVLLGIVLADRLAHSSVQSLEDLGAVTERLRHGDLDARARVDGPKEVADVARTVNELAEQINVLLTDEREAVADLSHRLRTPLTALQLQAESIRAGKDRERTAAAVAELTDEVNAVIRAARGPRASRAAARSVDLAAVVDQRMAFWSVLARQQKRSVEWARPSEPVLVGVSSDELVAAFDALLTNVFQHTPEETPFAVEVLVDGGVAHLVVDDDGPGVRPRSATARGRSGGGSTGLGLDIVRRTAERSGGAMDVQSSARTGTRVDVSFGLAAGEPA